MLELEDDETTDLKESSTSSCKKMSKAHEKKTPMNVNWFHKSIGCNEENTYCLGCRDLPQEMMALETPMNFFDLL